MISPALRFASLTLLPLAAACANARSSRAPALDLGSPVPVAWEARVGAGGLEAASAPEKTDARSGRSIELRCSLYRLDRRASLALPDHPAAWKADAAAVARLLETGGEGAESVTAPRLVFLDGASATLSVLQQKSFVGAFDATWSDGAWIADPVVATVEAGLRVEARGELSDEGAIDLAVALRVADLVSPPARTKARLVAAGEPVTVESPIVRVERLSTEAALSPDDRLVVACPDAANPATRLLAIFEAREAGRVVAAAAPRP